MEDHTVAAVAGDQGIQMLKIPSQLSAGKFHEIFGISSLHKGGPDAGISEGVSSPQPMASSSSRRTLSIAS